MTIQSESITQALEDARVVVNTLPSQAKLTGIYLQEQDKDGCRVVGFNRNDSPPQHNNSSTVENNYYSLGPPE